MQGAHYGSNTWFFLGKSKKTTN